jgi:hypothetical protein
MSYTRTKLEAEQLSQQWHVINYRSRFAMSANRQVSPQMGTDSKHVGVENICGKVGSFHTTLLTIFFLILMAFLSTGCTDDCQVTQTYIDYEPVYMTTQEIRESFRHGESRDINNPGRIYYKDKFLYINEAGEGVHVIDNTDPSSPSKIGFVSIPGNFDIAAKGNYMYADSFIDMVVMDISDPSNIKEISRLPGVFSHFRSFLGRVDFQKGVVTEYNEVVKEYVYDTDCDGNGGYYQNDILSLASFDNLNRAESAVNISSSPATGIGGSMARFTIYNDYLYTINESQLELFDISELSAPEKGSVVELGWGIETLFPYGDKLFIGANNGMHIMDNQIPEAPKKLSTYEHVRSCDPVVVRDNYAFVTLRSGNTCAGFTNQLDIVDISDLSNPTLFKTYPMDNPHGLGVDGDCLFITEGDFGLKFFDARDVNSIEKKASFPNIHAIDVIPLDGVLMLIGDDGLYQYNYDCEEASIDLLSAITITPL